MEHTPPRPSGPGAKRARGCNRLMATRSKKALAPKPPPQKGKVRAPAAKAAPAATPRRAPSARRTSARLVAAPAVAKPGRPLATVKAAPVPRRTGAKYLVVVESPAKAK